MGHREADGLLFVVQKHAATRVHYDFRLELDGVLKSWAVPKGPSLDPGTRRLAMHVEDHPLEYGSFEGVIPEGEYGGGTVMLWDSGEWIPESEDPLAAYQRGRLDFRLKGKKLRGSWHLVRMGDGKRVDKQGWLLIKSKDRAARPGDASGLVNEALESVATGRTLEQIAADRDRVWSSKGGAMEPEPGGRDVVEVAGVRLSNPDRVLYPEQGITKRALAEYYECVAEALLPQIRDRPLTLVRCPSGREKQCFFQKHAKKGIPDVVPRVTVQEDEGPADYMRIDGLPAVVALVQLGVLEFHVWGARADRLDRPDRLVLDLDPDPGLPWSELATAALLIRERLGELGLESFVRTTGGKGLHVVFPVERRTDWETAKGFTRAIAEEFVREWPQRFIATASKKRRTGKIFVDYLRNAPNATAITSWSTRARPGAPVAVPLRWDELLDVGELPHFDVVSAPRRLHDHGDPWSRMGDVRQSITKAMLRSVGLA